MAESEILETERLQLIPFSQKYCTRRYVSWLNDPIIMRYSEQRHVNHSLESCQNYYKSFIGTPHYFWAIVGRELGHIGNANAYIDTHNKIADIGIVIGEKNFWGQGYGLEVWRILCTYLLDKLKLRKVTAGAMASNLPMLSVMKKAGMIEEGRRLRHYLWEGQEIDIVYMALFKTT